MRSQKQAVSKRFKGFLSVFCAKFKIQKKKAKNPEGDNGDAILKTIKRKDQSEKAIKGGRWKGKNCRPLCGCVCVVVIS
jgi:hypothetical protein